MKILIQVTSSFLCFVRHQCCCRRSRETSDFDRIAVSVARRLTLADIPLGEMRKSSARNGVKLDTNREEDEERAEEEGRADVEGDCNCDSDDNNDVKKDDVEFV